MLLTVQDWIFQVDLEQTIANSEKIVSDHCQCGYCRNYYAAIGSTYPELPGFLKQFGIDVEGPDELMPFEPTLYEVTYCVCGQILHEGTTPISVGQLSMKPLNRTQLDYETECPAPCFALVASSIELPWLLEEDMEEVVSPANEPEYLQRMWDRLLRNASEEILTS